jgi:hypothetical protein
MGKFISDFCCLNGKENCKSMRMQAGQYIGKDDEEQSLLINLIQYRLGSEKFEKLSFKSLLFSEPGKYTVCVCGTIVQLENLQSFFCPACMAERCKNCLKSPHPGKQCGFDDIIEALKEENWPKLEDGTKIKILACPYCAAILSKADDGCDKMKCSQC